MDGDDLQNLDRLYFENEENFNLDHVTNNLPENLTSDYLLEYKERLEKLLTIVSRKVSELILSHQPTYVDELKRIADLQKSITHSIRVCTQGRSCLKFIKEGTAKNGSTIVDHYRKRESLSKLLDSLTSISDLRKSVFEIRGLIDSQEDFPKAIQMCKDGKALLASFEKYTCVTELGSKLNDTIELIGEQVDTVLSKMCLSYDPCIYAKLQTSYVLMDRSEIAVDQLLMHFCSAINSQAHITVIKRLDQSAIDKKDFQELCKMISSAHYSQCLVELCNTFLCIMMNYKRILKWHQGEDNSPLSNTGDEFKKTYIEQKLIGGLNRLWYDMKRKLSLLILNHDFSTYQFDEFIKILGTIDQFMQIGNEFCGSSSSEDLRDCINKQALNFFNAYHKSSMDELRMFLENELWDVVPVKNDFKLVDLKEFSFLPSSSSETTVKSTYFDMNEPLPLDKISLSSDSDDDSELNKEFVEEDEVLSKEQQLTVAYSLTRTSGPVLTNSSLNVLRLFGRYIQMMSVLEPISYEILMRIYNLLDHYTMVVYRKFGPDSDKKTDDKNMSPKLKVVIRSIRESLVGAQSSIDEGSSPAKAGETSVTMHQGVPNITNMIAHDLSPGHSKLDEPINPKKAVAIESLIFLVNQLWNLQEYLESLIPGELRPQLKEQFSQSQSIVPDFLKARAEMNSGVTLNS